MAYFFQLEPVKQASFNIQLSQSTCRVHVYTQAGVTGQNIHVPPAGIYPGLKRPRLDYTRVYYGLGQFTCKPRGRLYYGLRQRFSTFSDSRTT